MKILIRNQIHNKILVLVDNPHRSAIYYDGSKSIYETVNAVAGIPPEYKGKIILNLYRATKSVFEIEEKPSHIRKSGTVSVMLKDEEGGVILVSRDTNRWIKFTQHDLGKKDLIAEGFGILPSYVVMRATRPWLYVDEVFKPNPPKSLEPLNGLQIDLDTNTITELGDYQGKVNWNFTNNYNNTLAVNAGNNQQEQYV